MRRWTRSKDRKVPFRRPLFSVARMSIISPQRTQPCSDTWEHAMKAGRNDPCPCGSGKKYKKCCLARDQEKETSLAAMPVETPPSASLPRPAAPPTVREAPPPPDPLAEQGEKLWKEFKSQSAEGRVAV